MVSSPEGTSRGARTRAALVAAARRLFVSKGYFATGTEEIVAEAHVGTRGALYHHFEDKRALFRAVFEAVEGDLVGRAAASLGGGDPLDQLRDGLQAFLDAAAADRDVQQVVLIDGPAVLGWESWRSLEASYGLGAIGQMLDAAFSAGVVEPQPAAPLAYMLLAALQEAALYVANASDKLKARSEASVALARLLDGLRFPTTRPDRARARGQTPRRRAR
jgi:AcrR family transcriptional regulator